MTSRSKIRNRSIREKYWRENVVCLLPVSANPLSIALVDEVIFKMLARMMI